nr:PREDICTED: LOW QUALITY PROTEIN: uncharacterized protein LOC106706591 [Latimeria chalumnae]|eukprot:XP_014353239.1 PREDICTED: LOW QUALITY PROTEIN: uncharacterized protein LOC106706591 [Latimeria chalumnae]
MLGCHNASLLQKKFSNGSMICVMHLYYLFLEWILPKFVTFNQFFQGTRVLITELHEKMQSVYTEVLLCYLDRNYILQTDLEAVDPARQDKILPNTQLYLGVNVMTVTAKQEIANNPKLLNDFYSNCRELLKESCLQMKKQYKFNDPVLHNLRILTPKTALSIAERKKFPSIYPLAVVLPRLISSNDDIQMLDDEWRYLPLVTKTLPDNIYFSRVNKKFVSTYLGVIESPQASANDIAQTILEFLEDNGLKTENLVGNATYRASVMCAKLLMWSTAALLNETYSDETNFLYLIFLKPILQEIKTVNKTFQLALGDTLEIFHDLHRLYMSTLKRLVKPSVLGTNNEKQLLSLDLQTFSIYLAQEDIDLGITSHQKMEESKLSIVAKDIIIKSIAVWNVRTLMDGDSTDRPECRTALIARELNRYKIDIAALSETHLAKVGQLKETGAGFTFFWSGQPKEEHREASVGIAIKSSITDKLESFPKGINDHLMTLRLPLAGKCHATIISVYAPTMSNPDEIKNKFYEDLDHAISQVSKNDKLIILGGFNACVRSDHQTWRGIIGKHSIGNYNSNGLLLLRKCAEHSLIITNTIFQLPNKNKTSWMHPRSKHWHLTDYILVRKKDINDVKITKAMRGAECWTDHCLIRTKLNIHIKLSRRPQCKKAPKKLSVSKLKSVCSGQELCTAIQNYLITVNTASGDIEADWNCFRDAVHNAALKVLGPTVHKHQDWFDENDDDIKRLLDEKHRLHSLWIKDKSSTKKKQAYDNIRNQVQTELRIMCDTWWSKKADELQSYADQNDMKNFYNIIKTVYGPQSSGSTPVMSTDESPLLTDKNQILERWADHFQGLLNKKSAISEETIHQLPQCAINDILAKEPTVSETEKAIRLLSNGKAPGSDTVPAEIYKAGGDYLAKCLNELFQSMWCTGEIPQKLKDALIVHLYKGKGNCFICDNHRGLSLLVIARKILARVMFNHFTQHIAEKILPDSQHGFRKGRGTTDMIFAARQLQEKCRDQNVDLYCVFVDLTKAFDTVSRESFWKILSKFGCPDKFIDMVKQFHDG